MKKKALIGVYVEVERQLGKGAFGEVCLTHRIKNNKSPCEFDFPQTFALKLIHPKHCEGDTQAEIEREMRVVQAFSHPHIVHSFGSWIESGENRYKGFFCLAMGLCDGGDLHSYISRCRRQKKSPSVDSVSRIMAHVLTALNYSHSKGVIHRDIKPGNLFLVREEGAEKDSPPKVVVGDFGLSRPLEHTDEMVKTRVGTPGYLSPEIIQGTPYNFKTDMFSVGAMMYELLAMERPFWKPHYGDSNIFWATVTLDPMPALFASCTEKYGVSLCNLVGALLSKAPERRPSAFEALTCFTSRLSRVVKGERIPIYADDEVLDLTNTAVIQQQPKSVAEVLVAPVSPRDTSPRQSPRGEPQKKHPQLFVKDKSCIPQLSPECKANNRLQRATTPPPPRGTSPAKPVIGHPFAWALKRSPQNTTHRLGLLYDVVKSKQFASSYDSELMKLLGFDVKQYLLVKICTLDDEGEGNRLMEALRSVSLGNQKQELQKFLASSLG